LPEDIYRQPSLVILKPSRAIKAWLGAYCTSSSSSFVRNAGFYSLLSTTGTGFQTMPMRY